MYTLLGALRMSAMTVVLLLGIAMIMLLSPFPIRIRGSRLPGWITTGIARLFNVIFNVKYSYQHLERLWQHTGFLFPNHCSYLDIIAMLHLMPVRFLAAIEVRRRPLIGWLAAAIDCVFVTRDSHTSRDVARSEIVASLRREPHPPIVIYPEGRLGPGDTLYPFRYGAFEMAVANAIDILPVALRYDHKEIVVWHGAQGESMLTALWRHARFPGPIQAELIVLAPVHPRPHDNPKALTRATQEAVAAALGTVVVQPPT